MNRIIERNLYSTKAAQKGGLEQRQIGVGILGLADCFFELDLAFTSENAIKLNKDIIEHLYYACLESSHEYSLENNVVYHKFEESDFAKGICQFDYWKEEDYKLNPELDWSGLKDKMKLGMSNSLLTALMPTATTSNLQSAYECFEPQGSNIFIRKTKSGEFVIFNKFLIKDLINLGIWTDNLRKEIILHEGSIQNIDFLKYFNTFDWTEGRKMLLNNQITHLKEKFLTVWEIKQKSLINMAKDRAPFVDQSQSMNLYIKSPTLSLLTSMHLYTWKLGLKTGIYYLRSQSKLDTNKAFGLNMNSNFANEDKAPEADSELCIGCAV